MSRQCLQRAPFFLPDFGQVRMMPWGYGGEATGDCITFLIFLFQLPELVGFVYYRRKLFIK
jgi:hypothetical protein